MSKPLKALALFAAMMLLPILADNFASRHPDIPLFHGFGWSFSWIWLWVLLAVLAIVGGIWLGITWYFYPERIISFIMPNYWAFKTDVETIQGHFKQAERELVKLLSDNFNQGGRKDKVKERAEWAAMATPTIVHIIKTEDGSPLPAELNRPGVFPLPILTQNYGEGYKPHLAAEAFELNKADMSGRGAAMGKISWTAMLLRELYTGGTKRAIRRIEAEKLAGGKPFIAPGIRQLLGVDKPDYGQAPEKAPPYDGTKVKLAAKQGGFPVELFFMKDKEPVEGWAVIQMFTGGNWKLPEKPKPQSMWATWIEYDLIKDK